MRSDSFERGGQPRSVPDHDRDGYERMIRDHRAAVAKQATGSDKLEVQTRHDSELDESVAGVVQILNGARVARHEFEQGHRARAIADGITAGLDMGTVARFFKDGLKLRGPHDWKSTRRWLGDQGIAQKNQHVHHGLIPQNRWGKGVPDIIKNQPPNLRPMESPVAHIRIDRNAVKAGLPRFTPLESYLHGTPRWVKGAKAALIGHLTQLGGDHLPGHSPRKSKHRK